MPKRAVIGPLGELHFADQLRAEPNAYPTGSHSGGRFTNGHSMVVSELSRARSSRASACVKPVPTLPENTSRSFSS